MGRGLPPKGPSLPLVARVLRAYMRSGWRGSTRLTLTLARHFASLQHVPVTVGTTVLHVDLRDDQGHDLLKGSPWPSAPWEEDEQAVMRQVVRAGDVALDVGGHIGLHTVLLAQLVEAGGAVHVFEPNPRRHDALAHTAASASTVTLHAFGLSDRDGPVTLFVPREDESMASLADWTEGRVGAIDAIRCQVRRLDAVLAANGIRQPDFIKCDVEGAERRVFEGARATLDRVDAPVILYEANARSAAAFHQSVASATQWLAALSQPRYRFFHVQPRGALVPVPPELHTRDDNFNLLAVPESRSHRLTDARQQTTR